MYARFIASFYILLFKTKILLILINSFSVRTMCNVVYQLLPFANISWLNQLFFSKFIALSETDISVLLILKHGNTFIAKCTVNDIEASIQSTNGIYRLISFLPLIPAIDLSSASIFLSCGKIQWGVTLRRFLKCFLFFFFRIFRKWRLSRVIIVRFVSFSDSTALSKSFDQYK